MEVMATTGATRRQAAVACITVIIGSHEPTFVKAAGAFCQLYCRMICAVFYI